MRRSILLALILLVASWLSILYINTLLAMVSPSEQGTSSSSDDHSSSIHPESSMWIDTNDDPWRLKVWKWREFLACESIALDIHGDGYNYVKSNGSSIEMSLLTLPEMDYVHVAGISIGDVWDQGDGSKVHHPEPLKVAMLDHLVLNLNVHEFRGAPLSPFIFPSWYALLTDLWFRVKNVAIEDGDGIKYYEEKVLGIDIFHHTMSGGLNVVMGMGDEYSRVEPCNRNFIYSVNLSSNDGRFSIDVLELLIRAQHEASKKGWYFSMDDVELVMVETVLESYWSYAYARIEQPSIMYRVKAGG